ncbi:MAG: GGDEF domain-containing protein [Lachnospiraceae bacterium]|nr:GGDEF domain-containing protein [Lachnospiraceae bacterium]
MNDRKVFDKTMHFLIHNSFVFTVIIMGAVHVGLLAIAWLAGVHTMAYVNCVSVIVYLFCILLAKFGHMLPVYVSIFLEVTVYAILGTHFMGWDSGSYCYLCSIIPIIIYFGCFLFKGTKRWIVICALVVNFAVYVYLYVRYVDATPIYELQHVTQTLLMVYSSFVMVFSMIFYYELYIYSSESEVGTLEQKNRQLTADAKEDVLTNLLNRRGFLPVVKEVMNDEKTRHFCIAFCDLDNFKRINDTYGHDCGDEVLRHITKLLKREMPGCEICRWGGEEFIILMRDFDMEVAKAKMEYIRKAVEETPTIFFNKHVNVTMTIGLEENKEIYHEPEEIIKVTDARMYYGKMHGKNIVIYEDMKDDAREGRE